MSMLQLKLCHKKATKNESNTCEFTKAKNNLQYIWDMWLVLYLLSFRTVEIKEWRYSIHVTSGQIF